MSQLQASRRTRRLTRTVSGSARDAMVMLYTYAGWQFRVWECAKWSSELVEVTAVADPVSLMLEDLTARYAEMDASEAFTRLYADDAHFGHVFASLHERLNQHFDSINGRAKSTKHYWADSSREMLALIDELDDVLGSLKVAGFEVVFTAEYRAAVDRCKPWLSMSYGSTVPEDFEQIRLIKFEPVFIRPETTVRLKKRKYSEVG